MGNEKIEVSRELVSDARLYSKAWFDKMIEIWQDRIDMLEIHDTGALRESFTQEDLQVDEFSVTGHFTFNKYGIYVERGVGRGYYHDNGGDIERLGKDYRSDHGLGDAHKRRPWFTPSWNISEEIIKNKIAKILGESYSSLFNKL